MAVVGIMISLIFYNYVQKNKSVQLFNDFNFTCKTNKQAE